MPLITSDQIRDVSVRTVEQFLNNKVPLSVGLAKQASSLELNSEQIHRAVEATNSIAFLKIAQMSDDRTVEFPLCKYAEVIQAVVLPDGFDVTKQAAAARTIAPLLEDGKIVTQPSELCEAEKRAAFEKMAAINEGQLQNLKDRAQTIVPELVKAASIVKADREGLEKLALAAKDKEYTELSVLVYGSVKDRTPTGLFKEAELKDVRKVYALYKEAKDLSATIKEKQDLKDRSDMVKEAFFASAMGAAGRVIGKGIGAIVSAPFKAVGNLAGKSVDNVASQAKAMGQKAMNVGRTAVGKTPMPVSPTAKRFGLGAATTALVAPAFDASVYKPGNDSKTGAPRDTWDALQRS